ncbi:MAG: thioesterase family protein [Proteobacteria bacterium]|nr:thioesterase family protein [Pseudomonadota bacterium]MDE3208226.1 thioesterase family protein [Pseudomonadota bacterium]
MENMNLKIGLSSSVDIKVSQEHTASHVGSGVIMVLATPVLVNFFETAALGAVEAYLEEGYQTVGTRLHISHFKATPVGMRVRAKADLLEVVDRRLVFHLSAEDEVEKIGEGIHERIIVNVHRFDERVQEKVRRIIK